MAVREVLLYPEEREALRMESIPLTEIDQEVKTLIADLKETLLAHPEGIGLAAPQIGAHQRVVVVRLGAQPGENVSPDHFYSIQVDSEGELKRVPLSSTGWKDVFEQSKT